MKTGYALGLALKDMMAHQPLETISVLELSKKCGVSRKTFYYHYHDIYDLLTQVFLEEKIPNVNNAEDYPKLLECVFNYYLKNEAFVNAALDSAGKELFSEFVYNVFYTCGLRFINRIDVEKKLSLGNRKSIARFYAYGYGNSFIYYISNYRHKTYEGLMCNFSFLDQKNFENNVKKAIKLAEK